jgi:peptide/nickel transport system substrate-binding protein
MFVRAMAAVALMLALTGAGTPRTLRVALTQEPGTLNPVVATLAVESDIMQFVFSGLTRLNEKGQYVPDLATRVPTRANGDISADSKTITYHLVHNAKWHDGVPVTSADVAFTFAQILNPKNNIADSGTYPEIERVETPDPYTARLVLRRPWAPAVGAFSDRNVGAIIPEHLLKNEPDLNHADFNNAPIGSGPYKLTAWHRGSDIVLDANPDYFRGPPKIAHIVIRFLTNDNTMMIALRTGELDMADRLNLSTYSNLGNVSGMLPALNAQTFWEHLTFNTQRAPMDDVRVRRALCYAFDVHELLAKVAHGIGALGPAAMNPTTYWYNRNVAYYPYDPVKAGKLLDAAGWKLGADGIRTKNGQPLAFTLSTTAGNTTREQTSIILQQRWRAIGADVTLKTYPPATFFALAANGGPIYGGKTDVALLALVNTNPDPSEIGVNAEDRIPPHGNNQSFWKNAEVTRLENQAAQLTVDSERKKLYDRIQEIEVQELPYYVIRWNEITDMRAANLDGVKPAIVGSTFWNIADWQFTR